MARILLIDTDERFIETLSAKIRALGHQVDAARTMARGLELAETDKDKAKARLDEMCRKLLANTVIENYSIELVG